MKKLLSITRVGVGFMILQHGLRTALGWLGAPRPDWDFAHLHAWAGPIETIGGIMLMLGLFTRSTAFFLSGEMAVAYFQSPARWASPGIVLLPIANAGEEAALNCFVFLWLMTAGGGAWSVDALIGGTGEKIKEAVRSWEPQARGVMRAVAAYMIFLHGLREAFGWMPAGPRARMPLDALGQPGGVLLLVLGVFLFLGAFGRLTALILSIQCWFAYFYAAAPRDMWPVKNGGNEVLIYAFLFMYIAAAGAGAWSVEDVSARANPILVKS